MKMFIIFGGIAAILFALLAFRFLFRSKRPLLGSVFAVFSLLFVLAEVKALQFNKMMSTPPPMQVGTVTSAVVKAEDWAPTISAVGSVSPVQGAMISTELP